MYTRYERNPVYIIQAVNNKTEMNVSGSKRTRYMECITMKITEDIIYVGVNDHDVDLFEGQYIVPNGMAYNSYVIRDEKIAVMDTVDGRFAEEWLANIEKALVGATPDYLSFSYGAGAKQQIFRCLQKNIQVPRLLAMQRHLP